MRDFSIWLFLVSLPALAALGHDFYIAFDFQQYQFKQAGFNLTALGKLWVDYSVDSYRAVREQIEPETWKAYINPVLRQPTALVAAIFPAILTVIHLLMLVLGEEGPIRTLLSRKSYKFKQRRDFMKKRDFSFNTLEDGPKKTKYKRK